jgi:hypothetical protein
MYLLKLGNHKLSRNVGVWTLPRSTCIGSGVCYGYCYARTFETMPTVINYRNTRLNLSKDISFENNMIQEIKDSNFKYIRLHECGDFYNQEYLDKWKRIAMKLPNKTFMTYTKAFDLDLWNNKPKNLIIFQSYGSNKDDVIDPNNNTAKVIFHKDELESNDKLCPYGQSSFTKCAECCKYCYNKNNIKHVSFLIHKLGSKSKKE